MTRTQVRLLHFSLAVSTLTGVLFAWMKYFMQSDDPFAVANHPLQPSMLHAHVLIAPILIFAFGWIFQNHILPKYRTSTSARRKSGIGSMALMIPMSMSGYFLQVATDEACRKAFAIVHWVTSGVFVLSYVIHLYTRREE